MPQKFERNPSSGLPVRNPSHAFEADRAEFQSDIVDSIKAVDAGKRGQVIWTYDEESVKNGPPPMSGITKIRDMSEAQAVSFCKSLLRAQPNIFKVHIVLGAHSQKRELNNARTRALFSNKPRFQTDVAKDLGALLADKSMFITEVVYEVYNNNPGSFSAGCKAYGVTESDYFDDGQFQPAIKLDYIKAT